MKVFEKDFVDNDEKLKTVFEKKLIVKEDKYKIDSIKVFKNDYPEEIIKLEEASLNCIVGTDLKVLRTEVPDNKWISLTKSLA